MALHPDIQFVTGDLGFGLVEAIEEEHPLQFLNAGITEQAMTGIAAGMALTGTRVFTYSICNFPTLRCLEQIRNDVCYHNADVKIVSVGGGLGYGALGYTHHAIEDLAIMRALPGMTVVAPGDPVESARATQAAIETKGPFYLRIGRGGERRIHGPDVEFELGRAITVRDGDDVSLLTTGSMLDETVKMAERLADLGISASVHSVHTVKPIDRELIERRTRETPLVVTIEEHIPEGGLGGAVAEVMADMGGARRACLLRLGIPGPVTGPVGDQTFLRQQLGLDARSMTERVALRLQESTNVAVRPS